MLIVTDTFCVHYKVSYTLRVKVIVKDACLFHWIVCIFFTIGWNSNEVYFLTSCIKSRVWLIFSVEKKFRIENIQFSCGASFPFPEKARYAQSSSPEIWCLGQSMSRLSPRFGRSRWRVRIPLSIKFFTSFQIPVSTFLLFNKCQQSSTKFRVFW